MSPSQAAPSSADDPVAAPEVPDLRGRSIVVTGTSSGIGAALALRATEHGALVAGCARRASVAGLDFQASLDIADTEAVDGFAAAAADAIGPIDLWVNNAAVIDPLGPLCDRTAAEVRRVLEVNVLGVWNGSVAFVRHRRQFGGGGCLLNITSGAGTAASAGTGLYSASKAAVDRLTEALALEESVPAGEGDPPGTAGEPFEAWAIQPGVVDTAMQSALRGSDPAILPRAGEFALLSALDAFNHEHYVADWLLAIAFDPRHRPPTVVWRLPDQKPRPPAADAVAP